MMSVVARMLFQPISLRYWAKLSRVRSFLNPSHIITYQHNNTNDEMMDVVRDGGFGGGWAAGVRPPIPSNWGTIAKKQKRSWFHWHGEWKRTEP